VEICADAVSLANLMKDRKIQIGVFHGFEYAQVKVANPDLLPIVVAMPHARSFQAFVVVHKDSKAEKLDDLDEDPIAVPRGTKAHCLAYLEKARKNLPAESAKPVHKPNETPEEVLNGVADGSNAAALVDIGAYNGFLALQPGGATKLRVMCKSEVFPVSVITYRKGSLSEDAVNRIRKGLISASQSSSGKPMLLLWNLKGFEEVPADYDTQLETILKSYPAPCPGIPAQPVKRTDPIRPK
jgi:ABC-type phosphate/phosphonate transport system substrate-binding protein